MSTSEPRFPARFDPDAWETDLTRSTPAGRAAGEAAKLQYEREGVPVSHLKPCESEGRQGINLPDCAKVYVPQPSGKWGMVFHVTIVDRRPRMDFIAFGVRHHPKQSRARNVYDIADERLSEITAKDLRHEHPSATEKT